MKKQAYSKPKIEIIQVEPEGIMALSAGGPKNPGVSSNSSRKSSAPNSYLNNNSWNELDDILNDFFTIKK